MIAEILRSNLAQAKIVPGGAELQKYLMATIGALPDEVLHVIYLDAGRRLIAEEQLQRGSLDHLAIYPRTLFRRALEHNAASLILAHNHPGGDATPSEDDVRATRLLVDVGKALDVDILDHIIVSRSQVRGLMNDRPAGQRAGESGTTILRDPVHIDEKRSLANARRTVRRRCLRRQLIGADELFGEPAWDMLIDLFISDSLGQSLSTSSLCVTSDASMSSAIRLAHRLCKAGLVVREPDPDDGRRSFLHLAPGIYQSLDAYFDEGSE
jgi:DNA repair protein RadC